MREANTRAVEHDHVLVGGELERLQSLLAIAVGCRHDLRRRPATRRGHEQDLTRLLRQTVQAPTEQGARLPGSVQRPSRLEPDRVSRELAAELERKERVTCRRIAHPGELGSGQLQFEPALEQLVECPHAERTERELQVSALGQRAVKLEGHRDLRRLTHGRQEADSLDTQTAECQL